jgi:hypothetical protein
MRDGDLNETEPYGNPRLNDTSTLGSSTVGRRPEERYFFVHLHKTGGTTLIHRLPRRFRRHEIYPDASDGAIETAVISVDHLLNRWRARRDEIRILTGHFPLCTAELLGFRCTTMTVLREPVERTLSYLRHHRAVTPADRSKRLEELYEDPFRFDLLIHNHMVKMLSLTVETMTDGALTHVDVDPANLGRAQENLERIDVVGLQEHFALFWDELRLRFGWQLGEPARSNQTKHAPIARAFRERIARDNELDAELYRYGRTLWLRRRHERTRSTHRVRIG